MLLSLNLQLFGGMMIVATLVVYGIVLLFVCMVIVAGVYLIYKQSQREKLKKSGS